MKAICYCKRDGQSASTILIVSLLYKDASNTDAIEKLTPAQIHSVVLHNITKAAPLLAIVNTFTLFALHLNRV